MEEVWQRDQAIYRFNCTFMELKFIIGVKDQRSILGFNCTFMELKYTHTEKYVYAAIRFNCTFMELKLLRRVGHNRFPLF